MITGLFSSTYAGGFLTLKIICHDLYFIGINLDFPDKQGLEKLIESLLRPYAGGDNYHIKNIDY